MPTRCSPDRSTVVPGLILLSLILTLAGALLATPARAGGYIAFDGSSLSLGEGFDDNVNPRGGRLRFGLRVSDAFDVELQAGATSDAINGTQDTIDASWAAAYLKGYMPVGDRSAFFALGGLAAVELTQLSEGFSATTDDAGFSFGFGLETSLTHHLDLSADWMRYVSGDEASEHIDGVSLGLKLYF